MTSSATGGGDELTDGEEGSDLSGEPGDVLNAESDPSGVGRLQGNSSSDAGDGGDAGSGDSGGPGANGHDGPEAGGHEPARLVDEDDAQHPNDSSTGGPPAPQNPRSIPEPALVVLIGSGLAGLVLRVTARPRK